LEINNNDTNKIKIITNEANAKDEYFCICKSVLCGPLYTSYDQPLLKKLENDYRVNQLFNTDLLHVQQYLFTKLRIEPTCKLKVEYDGSRLLGAVKIDDEDNVNPPPFSMLYFDLHTYSGLLASDDAIRLIKVRYEGNEVVFANDEEKIILQQFSDFVH